MRENYGMDRQGKKELGHVWIPFLPINVRETDPFPRILRQALNTADDAISDQLCCEILFGRIFFEIWVGQVRLQISKGHREPCASGSKLRNYCRSKKRITWARRPTVFRDWPGGQRAEMKFDFYSIPLNRNRSSKSRFNIAARSKLQYGEGAIRAGTAIKVILLPPDNSCTDRIVMYVVDLCIDSIRLFKKDREIALLPYGVSSVSIPFNAERPKYIKHPFFTAFARISANLLDDCFRREALVLSKNLT